MGLSQGHCNLNLKGIETTAVITSKELENRFRWILDTGLYSMPAWT